MAWNQTLTSRLRYYIGDIDESNEVWSNSELAKLISMAAIDVLNSVSLSNTTSLTLEIDTNTPSISPDPTTNAELKNSHIAELFVLKAAYIIAMSEYRKDISKFGIRIRDDTTSFDGTGALKARSEVLNFYKGNYEKAEWEWNVGNIATCRAILGPYASADSSFGGTDRSLLLYYTDSHRARNLPY